MTTLRRYRRHAELYSPEGVFEAASADGFEPVELGRLALALRTVDPSWRLTRGQALELAVSLVRFGAPDKDIREMCSISQPTVREAHCRAAQSESFDQVLGSRP